MKKAKITAAIGVGLLVSNSNVLASNNVTLKKTQEQPNIILFLVDDMGWTDTSVPFAPQRVPANDFFRTPAMEKLAKNGVKFTQAYSHAVCSPSRISLMTGQNPVRHHTTNWLMVANSDAQNGSWGPNSSPIEWDTEGIAQGDVTLAKQLKDAGYYTMHVGKAHFGAVNSSGADPLNLGFDVNIGGHAAGAPGSYQGEKNFGNDLPVVNDYPQGVPGLREYHGKKVHLTDVLTGKAQGEIEKALTKEKPFFLNMAYYAVHEPIEEHYRFIDNYRGRKYKDTNIAVPDVEARYASLIAGMDDSVGSILRFLEEKGIADNTIVVFTSDNGGLSAHSRQTSPRGTELNTHNYPLKAGKASAYDGGARVPYLVSWAKPNLDNPLQQKLPIESGSASNSPIVIEDLFPTLLSVAQTSPDLPKGYILDGVDTSNLWVNPDKIIERSIVMHYPHVWGTYGPGYEPHSSLRKGDYKAIYFYNSRTWEMYNTKKDIGERIDLAQTEPQKLNVMAATLKQELICKDVQWPVNRITGKDEVLYTPTELAQL